MAERIVIDIDGDASGAVRETRRAAHVVSRELGRRSRALTAAPGGR